MTFFSGRTRTMAGISVLAVAIAVGGAATAAIAVSTAWSTPADLSASGYSASDPQVTVDGSGRATAVWQGSDGSNAIVQASTSLNGGTWSTPANLSAAGEDAFDPQVTVDGSGLATAVWFRWDSANSIYIVQASTSRNGGTWSTPADLSDPGRTATAPQVTVDGSGLATAVWDRYDGSNTIVQAKTSQNGGLWSTVANLSANGENAAEPQVTVDGSGLATAVWRRQDSSNNNNIVQASTSQNGRPWSTPADLSDPGYSATAPQVTVDGSGLATAVWYRNFIVQAKSSQSGAAWSAVADLSDRAQYAGLPQVTVDGSGLATAVWMRIDRSSFKGTVQTSTSQSGAAWSAVTDLSDPAQNAGSPQVTVNGSGFATAVWMRSVGSNAIVQASYFDNRVPITPPVTPPALAATGVDTTPVALTSIFALLAMFAGIGMIRIRRTQATPTMVTSSQQRQRRRNH